MADIKYLDLDLQIKRTPNGYHAEILNSPAGQAASDFSLPFSDLELENLLLRLGGARRGVRRIESPEMEAAKNFGSRLFNTVFVGDMRSCLMSSQYEAEQQGAGLRVRLRLTDTPELGDLPWEYLYNSALNRFLVLSVKTPLVRYLDLPERIRPLIVKPPLRVLAMISNPSDYEPLDVEREFGKLQQSLADAQQRGLVLLEKLQDASLVALQRRLQQAEYHIFHFVGHGGFDERQQDGVLILEDQEKRGRRVSAQYLGTVLHDHGSLRLAILNACEGARTSRTDPFAGVAQSLVQQGIPAVIAMQFEITDEAAITFAQEFYGVLALGYPVDGALAEARKTIFAQGNELEWGTPVLYLRSPDGRIFDLQQVSEEDKRRAQLAALTRDAQMAAAASDWTTAQAKAEAILALDAANADAAKILAAAKQQHARAEAYAKARAEYDAGHWREALSLLNALRGYRDSDALISIAERESVKAEAVAAPIQPLASAPTHAAPATTTVPEAAPHVQPAGSSNRVLVGAGALVVLLCGLLGSGWFVWSNFIHPPAPSPLAAAITPTATSTSTPAVTPSIATNTRSPTARPSNTVAPTSTSLPTSTPVPTPVVPTLTPTSLPPPSPRPVLVRPTLTPTLSFAPGVYVTQLRLEPINPLRGQAVTFLATFVNTTDAAQTFNWRVRTFDSETGKSFYDTTPLWITVPVGTNEFSTGSDFAVRGPGACVSFYAQASSLDENNANIPFNSTDGSIISTGFAVCPS
jgi:hypothetical protein